MRTVRLNNGVEIPQLGLGTARNSDEVIRGVVRDAIDVGYRLIDTAAKYENEVGVGQGIADSGVPRDELFVTTKLRGSEQGLVPARAALAASLSRLGLDHVDLYLIHWPLPRLERYAESWVALEQLLAEGLTRAIGVSNFLPEHLDRLASSSSVVPAVNQIELHPAWPQYEQVADDTRRGIATQSWSPLANAGGRLTDPGLAAVAERHGRSPVQIVLAWHLHRGLLTIPKASSRERLAQNLAVFDIALSAEDLAAIDRLDTHTRSGNNLDPATHEEF